MSRTTFLKAVTYVATVPAVIGAIAIGYQKPANAALGALAPAAPQTFEALETSTPVAPAELISRYDTYSFRLINGRSRSIHYFYASPSNVSSWEEDILGDSTLSSDSSMRVTIDDNRESCYYDFKAVFSDGSSSTEYDINVCRLSSYTF